MVGFPVVVISFILHTSVCSATKTFPPGFLFGAATASYQVEGAWNVDGKGESIWDRLVHTNPEAIIDNSTADIAADSYNRWKEDIRIACELGLHFYRFSISWPRLFPSGFTNKINEAGVKYYNELIDGLLAAGIQPVVTLYHWELPVKIQDLGGWANPLISDWFADYARSVFSLYGDRVKVWLTINEPLIICDMGFIDGNMAPAVKEEQLGPYICTKNLLMAHAKAYRIYDRDFRMLYGGQVSIANHLIWFEAESPGDEDIAELAMEYSAGRYCHPIFSKSGGWPPRIEKLMWEVSQRQGYNRSRLPYFTSMEKKFIRGTADFFGFNYYTSRTVRRAKPGEYIENSILLGFSDLNVVMGVPPDSYYGASSSLIMYPVGLRYLLSWLKKSYGNWNILITENGYPSTGLELDDYNRVQALKEHLEQVHRAIYEDGVNVIGYTFWSLMDNFEWLLGYSIRFGLYEIDFHDPELKRVARVSANYYKCVIQHNSIDVPAKCFNEIEAVSRAKRQTNPLGSDVTNSLDFMKELYQNRRCIVKVMSLVAKMTSIKEGHLTN